MDSVHDREDDTMPVVPRPDLTRLAALLCGREYGHQARAGVLAYARDCGTLEGCVWLEDCDRADADALLEDAWPSVRQTSHAWDEDPWGEPHEQPTWTLERRARIEALYEVHGATLAPSPAAPIPPELELGLEPCEHSEEDELFHAAWSDSRLKPSAN